MKPAWLLLLLTGCVQTTGGEVVAFSAKAGGDPGIVTGAPLTFTTPAGFDVTLAVRGEDEDHLWAALRRVIPEDEPCLLVLPDTTWTCRERLPAGADLAFGVFDTDEPHRFSLVHDGRILTKPRDVVGVWQAWGCVYWTPAVARFWREREARQGAYPEYDRAFEDAMREFGWATFRIEDYNDLGTWNAYASFVRAA